MLLDSNIIIYAIQPENVRLRQFIADHAPAVSALSYVEVLGYHRLTEADRTDLEEFFQVAKVLPIGDILPTLMLTHRARASQWLQLLLRTLPELY
jgi:predicted nucleic acid-binding protein